MSALRSLALAAALVLAGCAGMAPPASAPGAAKTEILWLGQAAFRISTPGGKTIVIDPWLQANPKTPAEYKKLEALGKVDLILVTHGHADHFADGPELARMHNAPMWAPAGLNQSMQTLGILPANLAPRMNKGGTALPFGPQGVKITQVHAEHSSEVVWKNPATGKDEVIIGGEPVGYIIELENGFKIYHMGDTGLFGDMKLIGERYRPDVVLIPIGNHFVMSPEDAAFATREWLKPKVAVPMHYGTIPLLRGRPEEYVAAMGNGGVKVEVIQPGDKLRF